MLRRWHYHYYIFRLFYNLILISILLIYIINVLYCNIQIENCGNVMFNLLVHIVILFGEIVCLIIKLKSYPNIAQPYLFSTFIRNCWFFISLIAYFQSHCISNLTHFNEYNNFNDFYFILLCVRSFTYLVVISINFHYFIIYPCVQNSQYSCGTLDYMIMCLCQPYNAAFINDLNQLSSQKYQTLDFETYQQSCMICLNDFDSNDIIRNLSCSHIYHKNCIDKWFMIKFICPMCRRKPKLTLYTNNYNDYNYNEDENSDPPSSEYLI